MSRQSASFAALPQSPGSRRLGVHSLFLVTNFGRVATGTVTSEERRPRPPSESAPTHIRVSLSLQPGHTVTVAACDSSEKGRPSDSQPRRLSCATVPSAFLRAGTPTEQRMAGRVEFSTAVNLKVSPGGRRLPRPFRAGGGQSMQMGPRAGP